jgi:ABC-type lipoprotein export system ATPase subunit
MSLLCLEGVSHRYRDGRGHVVVLDDASFEVEAGEFVGIWGLRRSGKTTLLHIAAGMKHPDAGTVFFDGLEMTGMSADRRAELRRRNGVGLLSGDWQPLRNRETIEHVALSLLSDGMSMREGKQSAWRVLERLGIADCGHLPADRLSTAERLRLALARVLVHEPRLLLVDEPAVLLRRSESVAFYELLRSLRRDSGLAVVVASEDVAPYAPSRSAEEG